MGGGTAAAGGGAGAGGSAPEDCLDGVDNDRDGLVDCADLADCGAGYSCVEAAPAGWEGFYRLRGQAYDPAAEPGPVCPDGSAPTRLFDRLTGAADCEPCQCGGLQGASCSAQRIDCYTSTNCSGSSADYTRSDCGSKGDPSDLSCRLVRSTPASAGSCEPLVAVPDVRNQAPFLGVTDVCGEAHSGGGGCEAGQACVARGSGDYAGYVCVSKAGEQTCPRDWTTRITTYTGASDTRGCSTCTCSSDLSGVSCSFGVYTFYDGDSCNTPLGGNSPKTVSNDACVDVSGLLDWSTWSYRPTLAPSAGGSCTPGGGAPTGSLTGEGARTYCCR